MLIKQPEDTDQFFRKKLDQLPVEFNEGDWDNLNKLLDQNIPPGKLKPNKIRGKLIFAVFLILSIMSGLILLWTVHKTEKQKIQYEQKTNENLIIEKDTVKQLIPSQTQVINSEGDDRKSAISVEKKSSKKQLIDDSLIPAKDSISETPKSNDLFW